MAISIEIVITPEKNEDVVKVIETLTRVATGFVMDGIDVSLEFSNWDDSKLTESDEEEETT